ncbi:hypothetical protein ACH347_22430 [Saccharopolyspora sp. 5N102]|uniref:hypothetical protein n=1 Tax=Saccharopolyspora sp. 5N102 TaxID=3375155 RepID=UPI0037B741A0
MTVLTQQIRDWLISLHEAELGTVLSVCDRLRAAAKLPHAPRKASATARDLSACRIWARKATAHEYEIVMTSAISVVNDLLEHYGFTPDQVAEPTLDQLHEMLLALGRPIGQLALYALLLGDEPASSSAREHQGALERTLQVAAPKKVPEVGEQHDGPPATDSSTAEDGIRSAQSPTLAPELGNTELDSLAEFLSQVRERAVGIAVQLRSTADELEAGRTIESELEAALPAYREYHRSFIEELAKWGRTWSDTDFDLVERRIAEWRAELADNERERQETARKIDELKATISNLDTLIAGNLDPGPLVEARTTYQQQLEKLLGDTAVTTTVRADISADAPQESPAPPEGVIEQQSAIDEEPRPDPEPPAENENPGEEPGQPVADAEVAAPPASEQAAEVTHHEDSPLDSPWEEGAPPVAVALVASGRLAEAYWVTAMSAEPDRRSAVLRLAANAYNAHNNADATTVLANVQLDIQELSRDKDAAVLAATALLRAGLAAGWLPQVLGQLESAISLPPRWQDLLRIAIDAARQQYRIEPGAGVLPAEDADETRLELGRRATELAQDLPNRKNTYQRGTRVLQRMIREGQPLGNALQAVQDWAVGTGNSEQLAVVLAKFTGQDAADKLIDEADAAVRTPKQAREPIIARARRGLQRAVEDVAIIVREAHAVSVRLSSFDSTGKPVGAELGRAVAGLQDAAAPPGMAGSAVKLLRDWIADTSQVTGYPSSQTAPPDDEPATEPTTDVLLPLTDLPRNPDGRPDQDHPDTSPVLARLVQPFDISAAVETYCKRGDLRKARRIVDLSETGFWRCVVDDARLRQTIAVAAEKWERTHRKAVSEARDLFARVRAQNLLNHSDDSTVSGRIEALVTVNDNDYHAASRKLDALVCELTDRQRERIEEIGAELDTLQMPAPDRHRIRCLLDEADTVTATEFVSFIREGKPLPEQFGPGTEELGRFTEFLTAGFRNRLDAPQTSVRRWAELAHTDTPLTNIAVSGITAWDTLFDPAGRGRERVADSVRNILRTLGLHCASRPHEVNPRAQRRGFRTFRTQASPSDGSYVSDLGSSAIEYAVTIVLDERRGRSVLSVLDQEDTTRVNIVLSPHPMDLAARQTLVSHVVNSKTKALVIDPAAFGWVAAKTPDSWRATQRVTLPWTIFEPYKPFVAGLVPPEVFVGRATEMSQVTDPNGGLFVYGGRQLGKSALLRRVDATFNDGDAKYAIYLDLKAKGIGEAEPASRIWRALTVELKRRGVLGARVSDEAPPETVINHVKAWLSDNPSRRVLLLADEADAFLTADSRGEATPGGIAHFRNVLGLKELMESTERRFKVVFAGLHQVQRFGHLSNVPLVHGGPDILIGPLQPLDARKLVVEPMAALGYRFDRPELVWRLLSATNYQASLIQIFCEELVRMLHSRRGHSQSVPALVTEDDVEAVAASARVRGMIAERLRITINLDDRYRVLTLVIALFSLKDSFGTDYGPEELLEAARARWSAGFDEPTVSQIRIYLDEMVGLGLLSRLPHKYRYTVRSPNVINMLGTKADLERELDETDFDLPYEYNPREARRLLARDQHGRELRSPLTDGQLDDLTSGSRTSVITGSGALRIDRVSPAIRNYAEMRGTRVAEVGSTEELKKAVTDAARRKTATIIVVNTLRLADDEIGAIADWLANKAVTTVLLAAPAAAKTAAEKVGTEPIRLARWTAASLRSWPECPFDVPAVRERLIKATGGWPNLVERTISWVVNHGATLNHALDQAAQWIVEPDNRNAHLADCGLEADLVDQLENWVEYFEKPGEIIPIEDVAAALDSGPESTRQLLDHLAMLGVLDESHSGVALDRVVHRCLLARRGES